ncbi:hypothetical protein BST61_g7358 [Cercospora zeina]
MWRHKSVIERSQDKIRASHRGEEARGGATNILACREAWTRGGLSQATALYVELAEPVVSSRSSCSRISPELASIAFRREQGIAVVVTLRRTSPRVEAAAWATAFPQAGPRRTPGSRCCGGRSVTPREP